MRLGGGLECQPLKSRLPVYIYTPHYRKRIRESKTQAYRMYEKKGAEGETAAGLKVIHKRDEERGQTEKPKLKLKKRLKNHEKYVG